MKECVFCWVISSLLVHSYSPYQGECVTGWWRLLSAEFDSNPCCFVSSQRPAGSPGARLSVRHRPRSPWCPTQVRTALTLPQWWLGSFLHWKNFRCNPQQKRDLHRPLSKTKKWPHYGAGPLNLPWGCFKKCRVDSISPNLALTQNLRSTESDQISGSLTEQMRSWLTAHRFQGWATSGPCLTASCIVIVFFFCIAVKSTRKASYLPQRDNGTYTPIMDTGKNCTVEFQSWWAVSEA